MMLPPERLDCPKCGSDATHDITRFGAHRQERVCRTCGRIFDAGPAGLLRPAAPSWRFTAWTDEALQDLARSTPYSFDALVQLRNNIACAPGLPAPRAKPSDVTAHALAEHLPLHIAFHQVNSRPDPERAR